MSGMAMDWAAANLTAKCPSGNHVAVLLMVAFHTDKYGRGCWAAQQTIATETQLSLSTVKRCIKDLAHLELLRPGDWRVVKHLRTDRRPDVWDIPMGSNALTTGQDDLSQPLNDRSIDLATTGQTITSRGVSVTYKPVKTEPVKTEPENLSPPQPPQRPSPAAVPTNEREVNGMESEPQPEEPQARPQEQRPAERLDVVDVVDAYAKARADIGKPVTRVVRVHIRGSALELVQAGQSIEYLVRLADWMGRERPGWTDLERASTFPDAPQPLIPGQRASEPSLPLCKSGGCRDCLHPECDITGWIDCDDGKSRRCPCWDKPPPQPGEHQTYRDPHPSVYYDPNEPGHHAWQNPPNSTDYDRPL